MKLAALVAAAVLAAPHAAEAFCGFYVAGGDQKLFNDATQVVLMRAGTRTVLSMQNNYKGPPEAFAMVVPVPVVLKETDVKTLAKDVFVRVEQMGAPRLVEYWEMDPCAPAYDELERTRGGALPPPTAVANTAPTGDFGVTVEAQFTVGEYQIVILSAKDSTGLDAWLRAEKYKIPAGAEPLLRPYVESGMKFFVAKVDPAKVTFVEGRAALSPLRFHYDTEDFALPIRLGLANSSGTQDLIVNILAPGQRYEVANYKNVTIPTNLDVAASTKDTFGAFYTALYDRTVEKNPGAIVTEYAWQATTCDPCPGPALGPADFQTLGADVVEGGGDFVLTRLHARYAKDIQDDLVFKAAPPIAGGREHLVAGGRLEEGAVPASTNNFQGRYAIRHRWTGPLACEKPVRGRWGGPPRGTAGGGVKPALELAFAPRGAVKLAEAVLHDVPEIDLVVGPARPVDPTAPRPASDVGSGSGSGSGSDAKAGGSPEKKRGCGCAANDSTGLPLAFGGLAWLVARRRPRPRRAR
ncbi:MAG: DUF2330 domain-containing protein [Myxococcales bacterium]|nr:DUF2330 domain-containing protein [Myxococcales bacterium]